MIEGLNAYNVEQCIRLAYLLWPDTDYEDLVTDFRCKLTSVNECCFLYVEGLENKEYFGFVQVSLRNDYVEGSNSTPVAYIEGIYIDERYRRKGIAKKLVEAAEVWAKDKGCTEIASDCELENKMSLDFHLGIGFEEANRIICFIKEIK